MATPLENQNTLDHDSAYTYVNTYLATVQNELYARGIKLDSALAKFSKFLDLPASAKPPSILGAVFSAVSLLVPELALLKFVGTAARNAEIAITIAEAAGNSAKFARTVQAGTKALELANKGLEIKEKVDKHLEAGKGIVESAKEETPPPNPLDRLNSASDSGNELIASSTLALQAWKNMHKALHLEYANRLAILVTPGKPLPKETMLDIVQKGLPMPPILTPSELDQSERLYLWQMIGGYVRDRVYFLSTTTYTTLPDDLPRMAMRVPSTEVTLEGLTDTQQDTILDLFGGKAPRGKIYSQPTIYFLPAFLGIWHVKSQSVTL